MKAKIKVEKEIELKTLFVKAEVRYWDDATVNDIEDTDGTLIPCREGRNWCPIIDIDSGVITNWITGTVAEIHYKVCDCCYYRVCDTEGNTIFEYEGYVPSFLCPGDDPDGDYIVMDVNENGQIENWEINPSDFDSED